MFDEKLDFSFVVSSEHQTASEMERADRTIHFSCFKWKLGMPDLATEIRLPKNKTVFANGSQLLSEVAG